MNQFTFQPAKDETLYSPISSQTMFIFNLCGIPVSLMWNNNSIVVLVLNFLINIDANIFFIFISNICFSFLEVSIHVIPSFMFWLFFCDVLINILCSLDNNPFSCELWGNTFWHLVEYSLYSGHCLFYSEISFFLDMNKV